MKLRNVSPLGQIDVPLIGRAGDPDHKVDLVERPDGSGLFDEKPKEGADRWGFGCLEPDEEFDVDKRRGAILLEQPSNFAAVDDEALKAAEKIADRLAKEAGHVVNDESGQA